MAEEYINRESAIEAIENDCSELVYYTKEDAIQCVKAIPVADVAEVRHGRWICINKRYGEYECSVCHGMDSNCSDYYGIHAVTEQEFCPSCGAKMDKEVADETCICQP